MHAVDLNKMADATPAELEAFNRTLIGKSDEEIAKALAAFQRKHGGKYIFERVKTRTVTYTERKSVKREWK